MYNNTYMNQGVSIKPNVITEGDQVVLCYNGLLAQSGATEIFAHIGYADGTSWKDTTTQKMQKTNEGFQAKLTVSQLSNLNIAFKDSANNWDNNSGSNYTFNVQTM